MLRSNVKRGITWYVIYMVQKLFAKAFAKIVDQ